MDNALIAIVSSSNKLILDLGSFDHMVASKNSSSLPCTNPTTTSPTLVFERYLQDDFAHSLDHFLIKF